MDKDEENLKVSSGTGEFVAAPVADFGDTIARNRTLVFPTADQVPQVPQGYRLTPIETQRTRLRWVSEETSAEFMHGIEELAARTVAEVRADLGEFAPNTTSLPDIIVRIKGLDQSILALEAILAACKEARTIAVSDAKVMLDKAHEELRKRVGDLPGLPKRYPHMERFYEMQGDSIREGRERAKKARHARPKPEGENNK